MSRFMKDYHNLRKSVKHITDGQVEIEDEENMDGIDGFIINIKPKTGWYKGGVFRFAIGRVDSYNNNQPPGIDCLTAILHPNIENGMVCLYLSKTPTIGLEGVVLELLFLLLDPNFEDTLSDEFDDLSSFDELESIYQDYYKGEIDGYEFIRATEGSDSGSAGDTAANDTASGNNYSEKN